MIALHSVALAAGDFRLDDLSLEVPAGSYAVLMGRTGSGKTTILEAVCGLKPILRGRIRIGDRDVSGLRPGEHGTGYVPQDSALFSTMTVREQLAFGPLVQRWGRRRAEERAREVAALLHIEPLLDRRPRGLSGGERQRVALGRALAARPPALCLDEPLSALDEETRETMCTLIEDLRRQQPFTALHVTHLRSEAERLADLVFRLEAGEVVRER